MLATEQQQCSAADSKHPLLDPSVLQIVVSYVGLGHHLFVAPVNSLWREAYVALQSQELRFRIKREGNITCVPQMTLYSSVFSSPSRVKLAHSIGLGCRAAAYQRAAGKFADIVTLATAHELGMEYTADAMKVAARFNKLTEVQFLHSKGCAWPVGLLNEAIKKEHCELVLWCHEHGCDSPWHASPRTTGFAAASGNIEPMAWVLQQPGAELSADVMASGAISGKISMRQYLREQQCPWSEKVTWQVAYGGEERLHLLRWLVDDGCPWEAGSLNNAAAQANSVEVLEYLKQQLGAPTTADTLTVGLNLAASHCRDLAAAK
jgi:hypothetical protein